MKKLMLFILVWIVNLSSYSQTFHAIIFVNTKNPSIGSSVAEDYHKMRIEFKSMANFIGYNYKSYEFKDEDFNRSNLENVINQLRCSPDDIVFFYYSGHGGRSSRDKTEFPQMVLLVDERRGGNERTDLYPIYNVKERIKAKNPRLTIVMGDLCNSIPDRDWITPKSIGEGPTMKTTEKNRFYKNLFFNMKGDVIAVSSKPGETSAAYSFGGAFTDSFLTVLQYMVTKNAEASWNKLFELTQAYTAENYKHTPVFRINLTEEHPSLPTPQEQEMTTDDLEGILTIIGRSETNILTRIRLIDKVLSQYFSSPAAKVEVVGKDGKAIVSTKNAKDYLNYLSIARNLEQVFEVDGSKGSDGKLVYLRVHEMYHP